MELGLEGKRAVVMGTSGGLGYAIAEQRVKQGARVAICSRDEGRIRDAARRLDQPGEMGARATFLASDKAEDISGQSIAIRGGAMHGF